MRGSSLPMQYQCSYTNINTEHGIQVFHEWLMDLNDDLPSDFPMPLFLKVLEIVMSKNIFQFDDLFFIQEEGTVMGTSTAVLYATIYYGRHEKTTLIPRFSACLQYFKRFVDDIFGIWIGTSAKWENFKLTLRFKNLHWKTTDLALKAHIVMKTYENQQTCSSTSL
jgi:hypothetical protein